MRAVGIVVLACSLAGCIEANLQTCGDITCPLDSVCLDNARCVQPNQLAACAEKLDGDDCIVDDVAGQCGGGTCNVVSCGNSIEEPGEACDDGNTSSGDGCSSTCTSREECGNGVVDLAEACDCGIPGAVSPLCEMPNSDDPAAECDLACNLRRCGDGELNTIEQCDGSVPVEATCEDFGFYGGTVTCSGLCQLSPTQCSGRCGDGVLDSEREYCDPTIPPDATCVLFGYDFGVMTCSPSCAPGLATCERLGWLRRDPTPTMDVWGAGGRIGVVYQDETAAVIIGSTITPAPDGGYRFAAGTANDVFIVGNGSIARYSNNAWTTETAPWSGAVSSVYASATHGLFVVVNDTDVHRRDNTGTWSTEPAGGWSSVAFGHARDTVFAASDVGLFEWTPGGWTERVLPFVARVYDVAEDATGALWLTTSIGLEIETASGFDNVALPGIATSLAIDDATAWLVVRIGSAGSGRDVLIRAGAEPLTIDLPPGSYGVVRADGQGHPIIATETGVYWMPNGAWTPAPLVPAGDYTRVEGAQPVVNTGVGANELLQRNVAGELEPLAYARDCDVARRAPNGTMFCLVGSELWIDETMVDVTGMTNLWVGDDDHAAVWNPTTLRIYNTGAWSTVTSPTTIEDIVAQDGNVLFVVRRRNAFLSGLDRLEGSTFTPIVNFDDGIQVLHEPGRLVLGVNARILEYTVATGTTVDIDAPFDVLRIAGQHDDIFATELLGFSPFPQLWHYNGVIWSPVRPAPELGDTFSVSGAGLTIAASNQSDDFRLLRFGPW